MMKQPLQLLVTTLLTACAAKRSLDMFLKSRKPREAEVRQLVAVLFMVLLFTSGATSQEKVTLAAAPPKQSLKRQNIAVNGRPAFVIAPMKKLAGPTPWVLYAPTLGRGLPGGAEAWMFRQFLDAGIAIAGVDVGESYGSPKGRATYNALHKQLTEEHGFAQRACLLARSRGGLMLRFVPIFHTL
jgi:hypothetical protein